MGTNMLVVLVLAALVCAWAAWYVTRALRIAKHLGGARVVTCPETGRPATVTVNVQYAFASGLVGHAPQIRLRTCSQWCERGRCDERCVAEAAATDNTARAIVDRAIAGKLCAMCGKPIGRTAFLDHYAAFLQPDHSTIEWPQVPPEHLRETARTHPAVCWDCHAAESFRRQFPQLVTDRSWRRN